MNFDEDGNPNAPTPQFAGRCIGIGLRERGPGDPHAAVVLSIEDDGNWFAKTSFSSGWLDEAIAMLIAARTHLANNHKPDPSGYGWTLIK